MVRNVVVTTVRATMKAEGGKGDGGRGYEDDGDDVGDGGDDKHNNQILSQHQR